MWRNTKNDSDKQNYHYIQIPYDIDVHDCFAMDYHVGLSFNLNEMVIPKEEAYEKIKYKQDEMKFLLRDEISDQFYSYYVHTWRKKMVWTC